MAGLGQSIDYRRKKGPDSQALNDAKGADAEVVSKDGEKLIEESRGPTDFRKEEDDDLSNDQKTVEDGPEDASRLVGNSRVAIEVTLAGTRTDRR